MSQQATFPQQAYDKLVEEVYKPVFRQKLARDWGIVPQNDVEEQQLLEMAGTLRRAEEEEQTKQAAAGATLINNASDSLKTAAAQRGYPTQLSTLERMVQKTAADAVRNPDLAQAALEFGTFITSGN